MWRPPTQPTQPTQPTLASRRRRQDDGWDIAPEAIHTGHADDFVLCSTVDKDLGLRRLELLVRTTKHHAEDHLTPQAHEQLDSQRAQLARIMQALEHGSLPALQDALASSYVLWDKEIEPVSDASLVIALCRQLIQRYPERRLTISSRQADAPGALDVEWALLAADHCSVEPEPTSPLGHDQSDRAPVVNVLAISGRDRLWFDSQHRITDQQRLSYHSRVHSTDPFPMAGVIFPASSVASQPR